MPPSKYSEEQIEFALQRLAVTGNVSWAAKDIGIEPNTLSRWVKARQEQYAEIRRTVVPQVRATIAVGHEDVALVALKKQEQLLARFDPDEVANKDIPKAAKDLGVTSGIHTDKAAVLRGMPDSITVNLSAEDILDKLEQADPTYVVDAEAVELPDTPQLEPAK